jgi:peptidoglycan/xylan/chitin deacetylase (PgdA/CDA1 family)
VAEPRWPGSKASAVVFSLDDVHPGRSTDAYEAGGDLSDGVLGRLQSLLKAHDAAQATIFVTPDWREICPFPSRTLARVPFLRNKAFLTPILPKGTMALSAHPRFTEYLGSIDRCELALHGLHHVHRGPLVPVEYQRESLRSCLTSVRSGVYLFERSGLDRPIGFCPPAWSAPPHLEAALSREGFRYLAASRDLETCVRLDALSHGSGRTDVPAFLPAVLPKSRLIHIPVNFQATSPFERAYEILEAGGLLSIKSHAIENACGHIALDALNVSYVSKLFDLFQEISTRFGNSVWWPTFAELSDFWIRAHGDAAWARRDASSMQPSVHREDGPIG